jgi:capsid protein
LISNPFTLGRFDDPNLLFTAAGSQPFDGTWGFGIGYDATKNSGTRKAPVGRTLSEDKELLQLPRRQLTTNLRDLRRNFSVASWIIRRHLDSVSTFHFRAKMGEGNNELNKQVEHFMEWWSLPQNCDPGARHSLQRLIRMWEACRTVDGDVLINRLADGRVQTIEGDRIQTMGGVPFGDLGIDPVQVINGVYVNQNFRAISYMVFRRPPNWTGLLWDKAISANFADLFGYFDRYDQVRGISPLASAANTLRDIYEASDYALAKMKATQIAALLITRAGSESLGDIEAGPQSPYATQNQNGSPNSVAPPTDLGPRYSINLGHNGPTMMDLDPGDDAKFIESQTPSNEFQNFTRFAVMIAMRALDLPYSQFDESHANYSGARMAGVQYYGEAVKIKQHDLKVLLDKLTKWRLGLAIVDGDIKLPKGMTIDDVKWEWSHAGIPLYDPMKEISGAVAAVNACFSSPQRECKKMGLDFYQLADERAEAEAYAKKKGIIMSTALASDALDDPANPKAQKEGASEVQENSEEKPESKTGKPENLNGHSRITSLI